MLQASSNKGDLVLDALCGCGYVVIPALTVAVVVVGVPLVASGVILRAAASGFASGLRSAATRARRAPGSLGQGSQLQETARSVGC